MYTFHHFEPEHKARLDSIFAAENTRSADFCFGNIYMWDKRFKQSVEIAGERAVTLLHRGGEPFFAFPVGSGDIAPAMELMLDYCRSHDIPLRLCGLEKRHLKLLDEAYPGLFAFSDDRDFSDYIYKTADLASYSGKRLHAKRNFCNRFEASHLDSWSFVPIDGSIIPDCIAMLSDWENQNADRLAAGIDDEHDAILRCFNDFAALGLDGGALYAEGRLIGFTVGEQISSDCYCTHFEKAYPEIDGAYAMLCRESAKRLQRERPELCYINREDDMGNPSLRKSKLSYKPEFILEKYIAELKKAD